MMSPQSDEAVGAVIDRDGRIVDASRQLAALNRRCGGTDDGMLAVLPLLEFVRKSEVLAMPLTRQVTCHDGSQLVSLWAKFIPDGKTVRIDILDWDDGYEDGRDSEVAFARDKTTSAAGAEGFVKLDAQLRLIGFEFSTDPDIARHFENGLAKRIDGVFRFPETVPDMDMGVAALDNSVIALPDLERQWQLQTLPGGDDSGGGLAYLHPFREVANRIPLSRIFTERQGAWNIGSQLAPVLKQPIGRIIANAETIGDRLQGPIRSDYASYATDIANAGRHLLELVDDLADLAAVEREDFSPARDRIDLADLGRRAAGLLAVKAADHKIRIDAPADDEKLPSIGEFRRVLQILLNLLTNAIRYSPDGSMIWIRLDTLGDYAEITVADQGQGLSLDEQAAIFDKFERLGRSGDGGSGLGLYISRRLAEAMGGSLSVESAPGQGARFTLRLPAA